MLLLSFAVLTALKAVSLSKLNSEDLDGILQILTEVAKMQGTAKRESVFPGILVDTLFKKNLSRQYKFHIVHVPSFCQYWSFIGRVICRQVLILCDVCSVKFRESCRIDACLMNRSSMESQQQRVMCK